MRSNQVYNLINYLAATVWLVNGLFCKVLDLVPRHEQIAARILQLEDARSLTLLIGIAETLMAFWIVTKLLPRTNTILQILVIATMNILELLLAPDLLLWGKANAVFALLFILILYLKEFYLNNKRTQ